MKAEDETTCPDLQTKSTNQNYLFHKLKFSPTWLFQTALVFDSRVTSQHVPKILIIKNNYKLW